MIERRQFLELTTLILAQAALGPIGCVTALPTSPSAPKQTSAASGKGRVAVCLAPHGSDKSRLRIFDWDDFKYTDVEIPIGFVHSITVDKTDANKLYLFEFFGSCLKFDLATQDFSKVDHRRVKEMFSGHGALSSSGEFIATTELTSDHRGVMTLRSAKDLKPVVVAPKECGSSHQVVALPGSKLLAGGNLRDLDGKENGAITFFDVESRKVVNRLEFPYPVLHLMPLSSTEAIGLTKVSTFKSERLASLSTEHENDMNRAVFANSESEKPSPLYYASTDGKKRAISNQSDLSILLDNFGLAKISGQRFLSGHHGSGKVILWENFERKHVFDVPGAKSLLASRDGTEFMAVSSNKLMVFSLETFERLRVVDDWPDVATMAAYNG